MSRLIQLLTACLVLAGCSAAALDEPAGEKRDSQNETLTAETQREEREQRWFDGTYVFDGPSPREGSRVWMPGAAVVDVPYAFELGIPRGVRTPSRERVDEGARRSVERAPTLILLNIEHVPVDAARRHRSSSQAEIQRGLQTLIDVAQRYRAVAEVGTDGPALGYFDLFPPQHMHAWKRGNRLNPVFTRAFDAAFEDPSGGDGPSFIDSVDFLAPAFYISPQRRALFDREKARGRPFKKNKGVRQIKKWVETTVTEARRAGKPVYGVLWHRTQGLYTKDEGGSDTRPYIGDELFELLLSTVQEHADGVILWSAPERYEPDAPWRAVIQKHMDDDAQEGKLRAAE